MPRPQIHSTDAMLDAARGLILGGGSRAATVEAIAAASGAPTGTIYHRFGSRDELVGRAWVRAVRRSQAGWLEAIDAEDPREAAVGAALALVDFCRSNHEDARLLLSYSRAELLGARMSGDLGPGRMSAELRAELKDLNRPVERGAIDLARRLYGRASRSNLDRTMLAVFDLPYGAVKRHLDLGEPPPERVGELLATAVRAVI